MRHFFGASDHQDITQWPLVMRHSGKNEQRVPLISHLIHMLAYIVAPNIHLGDGVREIYCERDTPARFLNMRLLLSLSSPARGAIDR